MTVKELVLKLKNRPGELADIVAHLYENDVKIPAFWLSGEKKNGTLRFIASDPKAAVSVLTGLGCEADVTDVLAVEVPRHPGGLNSLLKLLAGAKINILHIYPCLETDSPVLILHVDKTEEAVKVLETNWIRLYDERIYRL